MESFSESRRHTRLPSSTPGEIRKTMLSLKRLMSTIGTGTVSAASFEAQNSSQGDLAVKLL